MISQRKQQRMQKELEAVRQRRVFVAKARLLACFLRLLSLPVALALFFVCEGIAQKGQWGTFAAVLMFLLGCLLFGFDCVCMILRPGPSLRMDSRCIDHVRYGPIPWSEVIGISLHEFRYFSVLCLGLREPLRYVKNAPLWERWIRGWRLRENPLYGWLYLSISELDKDTGLIYRAALTLRRLHDASFLDYWDQNMKADEISSELSRKIRIQEMSHDVRRMNDALLAMMRNNPGQVQVKDMEALHNKLMALNQERKASADFTAGFMQEKADRAKKNLLFSLILAISLGLLSLFLKVWNDFYDSLIKLILARIGSVTNR
jgi:hypothetical protein